MVVHAPTRPVRTLHTAVGDAFVGLRFAGAVALAGAAARRRPPSGVAGAAA